MPGTSNGSAKWINIPASPENISGGYLLEIDYPDRYDAELCGFVTDNGQPVVIKSPELASEAEVRYIQAFVNEATNALYSDTGYNEKGKHYSEYFDVDALVNMYILQELSSNIDAGFTSLFLYKAENSDKLVFSPIWDLDHAFGDEIVRFGVNNGDPDVWWTNSLSHPLPTVFNAAFRRSDFRSAVRERWEELIARDVINEVAFASYSLSQSLAASGAMNIIRWNSAELTPDAAARRYTAKVAIGDAFIERRCAALSKGFSENTAMLYYDANGGSGNIFNPYIALIGETVTVIDRHRGENNIVSPDDEKLFVQWNTAPDGSGDTYQPGDEIMLTDAVTTLYAIWKTQAEIDAITLPSTEPETEPTTQQPDAPAIEPEPEPEPETDLCPWDQVDHGASFFGKLIRFFHNIFYFFAHLFGIR